MSEEEKKDREEVAAALKQLDKISLLIIKSKVEALRDYKELARQDKPA